MVCGDAFNRGCYCSAAWAERAVTHSCSSVAPLLPVVVSPPLGGDVTSSLHDE